MESSRNGNWTRPFNKFSRVKSLLIYSVQKCILYTGYFQVEYMLIKFDHKNRTAKLSLNALPVLDELQKTEKEHPE